MNTKPTPVELVKKHWFWGALVVTLGTITACWWMGTAAIAKNTSDRTSEVEGDFGAIQTEMGKEVHPNESFAEGMEKIGLTQGERVWQAWNDLYQYQLEKVLIWPASFPPGVRDKFESGAFFKMPASSSESVQMRDIYRNYLLLDEPKRLRARLKPLEPEPLPVLAAPAAAPKGVRPGAAPRPPVAASPVPTGPIEIQYKGLVKWENYESIFSNYPWLNSNQSPSPLAIKYCQEDLWAYTGIFDVITAANEGITDYKKARVKEIFALEIGPWVAEARSSILATLLPAAPAGGEMPTPGSGSAPGAVSSAEADKMLRYNRYLKADGTPLGVDEENADPEFNLIPFRLVVMMDQRQITKLLSVCANSTLPIRVKQVQMFGAAGAVSAGGGRVSPVRPRFAARPGATGDVSSLPLPSTAQLATPFDVAVELRGVIYIYQRPSKERLPEMMKKVRDADAAAAAEAAVDTPIAPTPIDAPAPSPITEPAPGTEPAPAAEPATEPAAGTEPAAPAPAEVAPSETAPTPAAAAPDEPAPADAATPAETPAEPAAP